jgi:hypothetical protein
MEPPPIAETFDPGPEEPPTKRQLTPEVSFEVGGGHLYALHDAMMALRSQLKSPIQGPLRRGILPVIGLPGVSFRWRLHNLPDFQIFTMADMSVSFAFFSLFAS